MRKLTREEAHALIANSRGWGLAGRLYTALVKLQKGEGIEITEKEWPTKTSPSSVIATLTRQDRANRLSGKYTTRSTTSGWCIVRIA